MRLWWRAAHPVYVIVEDNDDLSEVIWNRDLGEHSYSEPMYRKTEHTGTEKELIKLKSSDLNCTIYRGRNGPVIYKRFNADIFYEGDKLYVVEEKTYTARPGANSDLCPDGARWGDSILAKTYSNGHIERKLV